ncbi:MAG: hypothetical protein IE927_02290 [Rhodobacterales bacterium]|nr:hypothetical protein [Rhodobacterales bacterium]
MTDTGTARQRFNILAVVQDGRLAYEAVVLAASLRACDPGFPGRLILAEPQPGPRWKTDPRVKSPALRALLTDLGAEILPFDNRDFGQSYPHGNKIEMLAAMPAGEPFLFLDTDTLVTGSFADVGLDFARPSASLRREGTWPVIEPYGPSYAQIWGALYRRLGLDMAPTLDLSWPADYWQRHLYFNAGWFFGACPRDFGARFRDFAVSIRDDPPPELVCQPMDPWLDQVALPLVIASFGGGRPGPALAGLDGNVTCHWRALPLLYARESDRAVAVMEQVCAPNPVKRVLKDHEPFKRLVYQGKGAKIRALFDRADLPRREQVIRNTIKRQGLWLR